STTIRPAASPARGKSTPARPRAITCRSSGGENKYAQNEPRRRPSRPRRGLYFYHAPRSLFEIDNADRRDADRSKCDEQTLGPLGVLPGFFTAHVRSLFKRVCRTHFVSGRSGPDFATRGPPITTIPPLPTCTC